MMTRTATLRWQVAGAALLTGWVLAACGLESVGTSGASHTKARVAVSPTDAQGFEPRDERHAAATIESGEITHIERIIVRQASPLTEAEVVYRVVVRLEHGKSHEFTEPSLGELKVGDRVQVVRSGSQPST